MRRRETPGCDSAKNARPTPSANPLSSILNGGEGRGEEAHFHHTRKLAILNRAPNLPAWIPPASPAAAFTTRPNWASFPATTGRTTS